MSYGHSPADCPNKIAWAIRQGKDSRQIKNVVMTINDDEDSIKSVLKEHGINPGTRKLDNRKLLRNLANSLNPPHLLVFRMTS